MATDRTIRTLDQMKETAPKLPLDVCSINDGNASPFLTFGKLLATVDNGHYWSAD